MTNQRTKQNKERKMMKDYILLVANGNHEEASDLLSQIFKTMQENIATI